nr:Ig G VH-like protein [Camelus dromedarius]
WGQGTQVTVSSGTNEVCKCPKCPAPELPGGPSVFVFP